MKWLDYHRERLVLVGFIGAILFCGSGLTRADFTFGTPTNLGPPVNSSFDDARPSIPAHGLSLYFSQYDRSPYRPGGLGGADIWVTTRKTKVDPWGSPVNLGSIVNSSNHDFHPLVSADDLSLYFCSDRPGGYGGTDIWVATRPTTEDEWGAPVNLGPKINTANHEADLFISSDGLESYFSVRDWAGGYGIWDIWMAARATKDDAWSEPVNLGPIINTYTTDGSPCLSSDGLTLFFKSRCPYSDQDIYVTRRATKSDSWGPPVNIGSGVNTRFEDSSPCVADGGSTLYFSSNRPGGFGGWDLWNVPIIPIVDLNADGIVDASDMCIIIDHWGENYSLCDIGPTPLGDGIVDVEDLIVMSEYLFTDLRIFVDDDALDDPGPGDPLTSDPLEDGSAEHPFDSIQEAIDVASFGTSCIVVLPGTYTGDWNRDISFRGKLITVRSIDPSDSHIVATTVIDCQGTEAEQHKGFVFNKSESARSILAGLTITNAYAQYGGGIHCFGNSSPTISQCVLKNNAAVKGGGGLCNYYGSPMVINCIFTGNTAEIGGGLYAATSVRLVNCTIAGNSATEGGAIYNLSGDLDVVNCVIWNNGPSEVHIVDGTASVTYSDIQGGFTGQGNIDADPLFADPANGDYHLKSQVGRWDSFSASWIIDEITSPCIDTGDPSMPVGNESEPNGARINMGAYGGTIEASMSP